MNDMTIDARIALDVAAVTVPVPTVTVDGVVYATTVDDAAWVGDWAFPPSGWSDNQKASWIGTNGHLLAVRREHAATLAEGDAYATSPEYLMARATAEVAETIRQREIDQRRLDGAKAYTKALESYTADRLRTIPCVTGDVVVMFGMTAKTADAANARAQALYDERIKADPKATAIARSDYLGEQRDWMIKQCVWPSPERIKEIAETRPTLYADMFEARDDMMRARIDEEGKGSAP